MNLRIVACVLALAMLIGIGATPALAQDVPPLPHAFYGDLSINGNPAPVGTQVEARGEGVRTGIEGNPIVTTEPGKYGSPDPLGAKLVVQGDIAEGTIITFYVNGVAAEETAEWHSGEVTRLDLTVTMPTVPPTVTTDTATGVGTRVATLNGSLTDLGSAASVQVSFEWGTTTDYGNETSAETMSATGSFSASLTGLTPNTTYHFRAKAVGEGISYGIDKTFTTSTVRGGGAPGARDTTPPRISDISVSNITESSADISWKTHEKSDSQVEYWSNGHQLSALAEERVISHLIHLTDLRPGTTYHFKVRSSDASGNLAVSEEQTFTTLGEAPAAAFTTTSLSISPDEVAIGETVTISVTVTNSGKASGSYEVTLKINGVVAETREVTLKAGASQQVTFTTAKDTPGSYSVEVDGLSGSFTVKAAAPSQPPPPPPPPPPPAPKLPLGPIIGGIIAAVVVAGLLIFFVLRRRAA